MGRKLSGEDDFTLQDFMDYMRQLKQLGSMKKMLGMIPGMGQMREQLENFDEREVDRVEAMINSMTPGERTNPKIINGSRRSRIAKGSGVTVSEINGLLDRFEQAKTMMRSMAKGGMGGRGGPMGMGGLPGGGKKSKGKMAPPPRTKKGKSGNPAKRAQQEREAAERAAAAAAGRPGSAFGLPPGEDVDPSSLQLPAGFDKMFRR
jgi:signal recognition particle subunit SRP54